MKTITESQCLEMAAQLAAGSLKEFPVAQDHAIFVRGMSILISALFPQGFSDIKRRADELEYTIMPVYRVYLSETPCDGLVTVFECHADSEEHAVKLALNAYPGYHVNTAEQFHSSLSWVVPKNEDLDRDYTPDLVIYSQRRMANGTAFWNIERGWGKYADATIFSCINRSKDFARSLPFADCINGIDARWVLLSTDDIMLQHSGE